MRRCRVYGALAGYADQTDHDTLRHDPLFKLLAGRRPPRPPWLANPPGPASRTPPPSPPSNACGPSPSLSSSPPSPGRRGGSRSAWLRSRTRPTATGS
jgi:hypothetical protein